MGAWCPARPPNQDESRSRAPRTDVDALLARRRDERVQAPCRETAVQGGEEGDGGALPSSVAGPSSRPATGNASKRPSPPLLAPGTAADDWHCWGPPGAIVIPSPHLKGWSRLAVCFQSCSAFHASLLRFFPCLSRRELGAGQGRHRRCSREGNSPLVTPHAPTRGVSHARRSDHHPSPIPPTQAPSRTRSRRHGLRARRRRSISAGQ